jgi:hypothetical protein
MIEDLLPNGSREMLSSRSNWLCELEHGGASRGIALNVKKLLDGDLETTGESCGGGKRRSSDCEEGTDDWERPWLIIGSQNLPLFWMRVCKGLCSSRDRNRRSSDCEEGTDV